MKTGEPDMPAKTPVRSTFDPLSRPIIVDWRAPGNPGNTPRISTPNSSVSLPAKTVRATPFIPARTSSSGSKRMSVLRGAAFEEVFAILLWPQTKAEPRLSKRPNRMIETSLRVMPTKSLRSEYSSWFLECRCKTESPLKGGTPNQV